MRMKQDSLIRKIARGGFACAVVMLLGMPGQAGEEESLGSEIYVPSRPPRLDRPTVTTIEEAQPPASPFLKYREIDIDTSPESHLAVHLWKDYRSESLYMSSKKPIFTSITKTADGGYVIAGFQRGPLESQRMSRVIFKLNNNGTLAWKTEDSLGAWTEDLRFLFKVFALQTLDGGYAIFSTQLQVTTAHKLNHAGNEEWEKSCLNATRGAIPFAIIQASDGDFVMTGREMGWDQDTFTTEVYKFDLNELSEECQPSWYVEDAFMGLASSLPVKKADYISALYETPIVQTEDGGYVVAGDLKTGDTVVIKMTPQGQKEWRREFPAQTYDLDFSGMIKAADGGFALIGKRRSEPGISLIKLNPHGFVQWRISYKTALDIEAPFITATGDGGYTIVSLRQNDFLVMRVDKSGLLRWHKTINFGATKPNQWTRLQIFAHTHSPESFVVAANMELTNGSQSGMQLWMLQPQLKTIPRTVIPLK